MLYEAQRNSILKACLCLQEMEYFLGTWGNVSMRVENHIILTPSRVNYDTMTLQDMVVIDLAGNKVEGSRTPTSEKEVHRQLYCARPELGAIIHAHTMAAMAVSALEIPQVPCLVEEMSQLLGGSIPLTESYVAAQQHEALGQAAADAIEDRSAVLLRNHGPVSCGRTMEEAFLVARVVEKACSIYLAAAGKERLRTIPDEQAASERYRYLYTYGKEQI